MSWQVLMSRPSGRGHLHSEKEPITLADARVGQRDLDDVLAAERRTRGSGSRTCRGRGHCLSPG